MPAVGRFTWVIVSPTFTTGFDAQMQPTLPARDLARLLVQARR
jgi:hypothetical protein